MYTKEYQKIHRKKSLLPKIALGLLAAGIVGVGLYFVPPIHAKLAWRVDELWSRLVNLVNPPEKVVFQPGGKAIPTITVVSAATATQPPAPAETSTIAPTEVVTPTVTSTPPPASVILSDVVYVDQMGRYNYCGPANLAMAVQYWGWKGEPDLPLLQIRDQIAAVVKPGEDDPNKNFVERGNTDVNVMPWEMVDYVNEKTSLRALFRYGGDMELVKRLIAAGFPPITEKGLYEPLLPDYSIQWGGHYSFTTGYDEAAQEFIWQDSYLPKPNSVGKNSRASYAEYQTNWRAFNYVFIVVYPPEREQELMQVLGPWADQYWAAQHALEIADAEIAEGTLTGNDQFFALFNRVTSLISLANPEYGPAAEAFDVANAFYNSLPQDKLIPYRTMWYQTAPYFAYYNSGRYQDLIDLANINLNQRITKPRSLEEFWFWLARAEYALGAYDQAFEDMRRALYYHPGFTPALEMLALWGATP